MASGALEDATVPAGHDDILAELERMSAGQDVDRELARMKAELPAASGPAAVEAPERSKGPSDPEATS